MNCIATCVVGAEAVLWLVIVFVDGLAIAGTGVGNLVTAGTGTGKNSMRSSCGR